MNTTLLTATAVIALTAGSPAAAPDRSVHKIRLPPQSVLYSQNSNFDDKIQSNNFTSDTFGTSLNSSGADDFVVPAGQAWVVQTLDVTGFYWNGQEGAANSEVVTFYRDHSGQPGRVKASYTLQCADSSGSFSCAIPGRSGKGLRLTGGTSGRHYWVSIVANCAVLESCTWAWVLNSATHNSPGKWENPGNGFETGCTTWTDTHNCLATPPDDDYAFDLAGHL